MKTETISPGTSRRGTDANRDPITGEPGSHPVGTGLGAAGGAAAGAGLGAVGGPIGMAVGGVAGAIVGGLTGHAVAEGIDPTVEDAYWKDAYPKTSYFERDVSYDEYQPAYRTGYEGYSQYPDRSFEEAESDLRLNYQKAYGNSRITWEKAKHAVRDAWNRAEKGLTGEARGDIR